MDHGPCTTDICDRPPHEGDLEGDICVDSSLVGAILDLCAHMHVTIIWIVACVVRRRIVVCIHQC